MRLTVRGQDALCAVAIVVLLLVGFWWEGRL